MEQKDKIKKIIGNMVKNTNFYYKKAKDSRIKNRKAHDQNKKPNNYRNPYQRIDLTNI